MVDNYLDIRTQENTVTAKSTAAMRDHETLTVSVQFPADTFNLRDQPGKTAGFDRIAFLVLLAAAVAFWFLRLRSGLILPRRPSAWNPRRVRSPASSSAKRRTLRA